MPWRSSKGKGRRKAGRSDRKYGSPFGKPKRPKRGGRRL